MSLRSQAISKIIYFQKLLHKLGYRLKIGLEMEFMAFAKEGKIGVEALDVRSIETALKKTFPGKIENFYKELPLGDTYSGKHFEYPGVQKYEVTFCPNQNPIEVCDLIYQVKNYLNSCQRKWNVDLDFSSKPIPNSDVPSFIQKAKTKGFTQGIAQNDFVQQATGCGIQFNFSLWKGDKNVFFNEETRDGTALFYHGASALILATKQSLLPFVSEPNAFLRLNPHDTETAAPGACKLRVWKGGKDGKGIIRPSPYPDHILKDNLDIERRTSKSFRMETRHNDPLQDQYVCMAAVLGALYYGMMHDNHSQTAVMEMNYPFDKDIFKAIESFEKSKLWADILGDDLYQAILKNARRQYIDTPARLAFSHAAHGIMHPQGKRSPRLAELTHKQQVNNSAYKKKRIRA
jgi:glutamine synthetase